MTSEKVLLEFKTFIAGLPCLIKVTRFFKKKGEFSSQSTSEEDYYGYVEIEYDIYDRKGVLAPQFEEKLTSVMRADLEEEISDRLDEENYNN